MDSEPPTFDEYWRAFVRAHASPSLRRLSVVSMSAAIGSAALSAVTRRKVLLAFAPLVAFGPPFVARKLSGSSSPFVESHPFLFAVASLKMWRMTLAGTMDAEVERIVSTGDGPGEGPAVDEGFPRPNMVTDHTLH